MAEPIRQHQMLARGQGIMDADDFGVEQLKHHMGKANSDSGKNNTLDEHERAKKKPVRWSKHHAAAESGVDHGKMSY